MDKNAIKKYAIYARNKLIQSATDKALTIGISKNEIRDPDVKGDNYIIFTSPLGTETTLTGDQINARDNLINEINNKGFDEVIEEVAYTWFNRLIAIRFMEVNDYLPSRLRVLSSDISGKKESDLMSSPFDADLNLTDEDKKNIVTYKESNNLNELFNLLFVKQCNKLNELLPGLFERTNEFTELLLDIRYDDSEDVVYKLVHDIPEEDFNVSKGGQVEIIGWLYQYYNTEPKDEVFKGLKKNKKITKENIPAATQLFTPDWIVRYMVENSLGRLWIEGHPDEELKSKWKYYLDDAKQEPEVQQELNKIYEEHSHLQLEDIKVIDPAMGSGHILVYMFDVLMQIYESQGYSQRDAAELILVNNLYGLDIDKRAYQLSYFSIMMKAREYNRRILTKGIKPHVYEIVESNNVNTEYIHYFGEHEDVGEKLISNFIDAKEYGSIMKPDITANDLSIIKTTLDKVIEMSNLGSLDSQLYTESFLDAIYPLYEQALVFEQSYDVVVTNPPYMGMSNGNSKLNNYVKKEYPYGKADFCTCFMIKSMEMCKKNGKMSMINIPAWMSLVSFENLRKKLIKNYVIDSMLHFGRGIFGSDFGSVAFVITNYTNRDFVGIYMRLFDKQGDVETIEEKKRRFFNEKKYHCSEKEFLAIPGSPIAYWLSHDFFSTFKAKRLGEVLVTREGMATADNDRFLRLWFEVNIESVGFGIQNAQQCIDSKKKWFPYQKGGEYRKWYGNQNYLVNWEDNGYEIKHNIDKRTGRLRSHNYNGEYAFKMGLTWTSLSISRISVRFSPTGFLFDSKGAMGFCDNERDLLRAIALLNSKVGSEYLKIFSPTVDFKVGDVIQIPDFAKNNEIISKLTKQCILLSKEEWDSYETSWDFKHHPLIRKVTTIVEAFNQWRGECDYRFEQLEAYEEELNRIFIEIYGLQNELTPEVDDKYVTVRRANLERDIRSLISYAVGCMFGRYSLDIEGIAYAGYNWDYSEYDSFHVDKDNIIPICDDEYFDDDIVGRFVEFIKTVYGKNTLEENLEYIAKALGNKGDTSREVIRNYFEKDFIKDHIKMYKKRPIYWLFNSGRQNGFKALIYMHRYDKNTVSNVRTEYLHKVQDVYTKTIEDDQYTIDHSSSNSDVNKARKHITKLQKQLDETKLYDMALAHIANERIAIDLDDGVKVNYAKFQNVEIINDNGKKVKINLLEKI